MRSVMTRSVLTCVRGVFTLKAWLESSPMYFWSCSGRGVCVVPMAAFFGGGVGVLGCGYSFGSEKFFGGLSCSCCCSCSLYRSSLLGSPQYSRGVWPAWVIPVGLWGLGGEARPPIWGLPNFWIQRSFPRFSSTMRMRNTKTDPAMNEMSEAIIRILRRK